MGICECDWVCVQGVVSWQGCADGCAMWCVHVVCGGLQQLRAPGGAHGT